MTIVAWLFGGVGGAIVATIVGVLLARSKKSVTQEQRVNGSSSTNIQAGRDVFVGQAQDDKEFAVQPIMHLVLYTVERGPGGHYLGGFIRNVGRGIARNPKIFSPTVDDVISDRLVKPMETIKLRVRYDHRPALLTLLEGGTMRVEFENEFGTRYEQSGSIEQSKDRAGYSYRVNALGPVVRCE